jgi:ribosomal protein L31E
VKRQRTTSSFTRRADRVVRVIPVGVGALVAARESTEIRQIVNRRILERSLVDGTELSAQDLGPKQHERCQMG